MPKGVEVEINEVIVKDKIVSINYIDETEKYYTSYSNLTGITNLIGTKKYKVINDVESKLMAYSTTNSNKKFIKDEIIIADKVCGSALHVNDSTIAAECWIDENNLQRVGNDVAKDFSWMDDVNFEEEISV